MGLLFKEKTRFSVHFEESILIRFVLKRAFKMKIPGVGHLARLLHRRELTPYLRTNLNKKWGRRLLTLTSDNIHIK